MDICAEIKASRTAGVVRCAYFRGGATLVEVAGEFGLSTDANCYHEIGADAARWLAYLVLIQDLAYNAAIVAPALATSLVDRFFSAFSGPGHRFFTNGTFHEAVGERLTNSGWCPATAATFDTGVMVVGPVASGILWVEDED